MQAIATDLQHMQLQWRSLSIQYPIKKHKVLA